jgi:hypothetical protein
MRRTNLLRKNNARAYLNYLKAIGVPFEMICSNYTVLFQADGIEKKFVSSLQSNRTFACFAKLKSNLKDKPIPDIDTEKLKYFSHDFQRDDFIGDVLNIDLKSAYATILYRDGYITRDTFEYISAGTKQERLVSVGMLASKKQHFKFDGGRIVGTPDEIISPFSNFFFYAVKRTSEIMDELRILCGNNYLFTWVDGIYFMPDFKARTACEDYLKSLQFAHTTEWLKDFKVKIGAKKISIDFYKMNKDGEWLRKPFDLPHANSAFKRLIVEAVLSKHKQPKK